MKVKLNLSLEEHVVDRIKRSNWGSASEYITSLVQKDMLVGKDALKEIHSKLDTLLRIVNREGETTMSVTEQELQSFDEYLNKEKIAMTNGEFYYTKEFQELLELANNKEERSMERIAEQVMALLQVTPERAFELLRDGEIREKFVEHIGNAWVVIGEQQAEIELLKNAKESTMEHCKYLDSLLERTDEGSIARAVDHALPEYKIDVCGSWYYEDETEKLPESVAFRLVEKAIYELYGYSSVELVTNVMKILHGLKMFSW